MIGVTVGVRMPEGRRWRAYFSRCAVLALDDDGVTRVVAPVELDDVVDVLAHEVGGLALAFVAPLGSDEHDCRHLVLSFLARKARACVTCEEPGAW